MYDNNASFKLCTYLGKYWKQKKLKLKQYLAVFCRVLEYTLKSASVWRPLWSLPSQTSQMPLFREKQQKNVILTK